MTKKVKANCCDAEISLEEASLNLNGFCKRCTNRFYFRHKKNYLAFQKEKKVIEDKIKNSPFLSKYSLLKLEPQNVDLFIFGKDGYDYSPTWDVGHFETLEAIENFYFDNTDKYDIVDSQNNYIRWDELKREWDYHCLIFDRKFSYVREDERA